MKEKSETRGSVLAQQVFTPGFLPISRITVCNRLAKVALYEHLGPLLGGKPGRHLHDLYRRWSASDDDTTWAMIITGNVQVTANHLSLGRDMVIPDKDDTNALAQFRLLSTAMKGQDGKRALAVVQLNHTGRQSANFIGGRPPFVAPLAPSPIRVGSGRPIRGVIDALTYAFHAFLFHTPREMTLRDIDEVVAQFVHGAHVVRESGFDGVQLHCAHGCKLSSFLMKRSWT